MAHSESQEYRSSESDVHRVEADIRDKSVVCIDTQMYMLSAEARKQALEGLQTPEGLHGGSILVPWANQQHLTLSVGYDDATGDHVHYIYVDSLAGPSSFTISKASLKRPRNPIHLIP